ncbi:MAG: hypothetical protein JXA21_02245 [Anaerolineae bacterium]|nr:hypothetical protein [Anaerolineae bacterium]
MAKSKESTTQEVQEDTEHVFNPGKARWLHDKGGKALDVDQQGLLLALAQLEAELGRELSEEESQALQALTSHMEGFNPEQITQAIREMVQKPADPNRRTSWPELKRHK